MGHRVGKDVYRALGQKLDGQHTRAPYNDRLHAILKELYTPEEAELVARMPYGMASLRSLARTLDLPEAELRPRLEALADKGLVLDLCVGDKVRYQPSPFVIGVFEFTMMRTRGELDSKKWAELFSAYMHGDDAFYAANDGAVSVMRALPHEGAFDPESYVEVLDYEKAVHIVESSSRAAIGLCSCRHEKHHLGSACDTPLETCLSFGIAADYLVRHGMAREASKEEVLEQIGESWKQGRVLNADNVKRNISFICQCCSCCCNALAGISKHGYLGMVVTSSYISQRHLDTCNACGNCSRDCPIGAIDMVPSNEKKFEKNGKPVIDESMCLGCGVCAHRCKPGSIRLVPRSQRVLHPETTFERVILQCLERGTLQNQLFTDPASRSQAFMRTVLGAFLRLPPVKQALMSDTLRSRFLTMMAGGASKQGKSWATKL